jgi:hypothetical protein
MLLAAVETALSRIHVVIVGQHVLPRQIVVQEEGICIGEEGGKNEVVHTTLQPYLFQEVLVTEYRT